MRFIAVLLPCLLLPVAVEAKPSPNHADTFVGDRYVSRVAQAPTVQRKAKPKARYYYRVKKRLPAPALTLVRGIQREVAIAAGLPANLDGLNRGGVVIGGRPAGCPFRFCGCGASLHLFGKIIPRLNLAANWLSFPRTAPAPNMVAARRGHVFVLKRHIAGNRWIVHDSNSGRGRTRVHPRSIAGYTIVNPRGA